jgi:hypothetical protein
VPHIKAESAAEAKNIVLLDRIVRAILLIEDMQKVCQDHRLRVMLEATKQILKMERLDEER